MDNISIHKSVKTLSEMLFDRGYYEESKYLMSSSFVNEKNIFNIDINDSFRIIYNLNNRFKFADIKKYFDDEFTFIVITLEKISSTNMKIINEIKKDIQVFEIKELQFNITKHHLVPKHILITNENEIADIVSNYALKSKVQLPLILKSDPICRYLNAKNGNILKILRNSPSSGEHVVYRYCM